MEALGVYRESVYSPGRESDDTLILEETAAMLAKHGVRVSLRPAEEIRREELDSDLVFTMGQGEAGLQVLQDWQEQGRLTINTVAAIRNCHRARTLAHCSAAGVPMPPSRIVPTRFASGAEKAATLARIHFCLDFSSSLWVKRADVHATQPDDVVQVWDETELQKTLQAFAQRGILYALLQAHCPGRMVKFYGAGPGRFFDCPELDPSFVDRVARLAILSATAVGLEIFGGDCAIREDGTPVLIDLNDWPSFMRCRRAAAQAIADYLSFWGGFHGKTAEVLGLAGDGVKQGWGPLPTNAHMVPYADCYRCPLKLRYPSCGLACADFIRTSLKHTSGGAIAAVIAEPIQGTAGNVVPPPEFLPALKEIAQEHEALFIADEMITGFGRTGTMFGCEQSGVIPDVMTVGKGMGNGFPVTGVISTANVMAAEPFSQPSASSSSYGGNPLAAAAVLSTVETIRIEGLVENARQVGGFMLTRLCEMQEKYEFIGDVRGRGLLLGLDLVKDRRSKTALSRQVTELIFRETLRRGLLVMGYTPRVRINPPLTISRELAETGLAILDEVFTFVANTVDYQQ